MGDLLDGLMDEKLKLKAARLDQFGQPGHNILYVTGLSGSGKSTLANSLAKKLKAEAIELDSFYATKPSNGKSGFHRYLKKNQIDPQRLLVNNKLNYDESDKIYDLLKEYAKKKRVIAEGVQLLDGTMAEQSKLRSDLIQEPIVSLQSTQREAMRRARDRDKANWVGVKADEKRKEWQTQYRNQREFEKAMGLKNKR